MNRNVIASLEQALENLKQASAHSAEKDQLQEIWSKFEEAFGELRGLQPDESDSPGRREAREHGFRPETTEEAAPEPPAEEQSPRTFAQAREVATERLAAAR